MDNDRKTVYAVLDIVCLVIIIVSAVLLVTIDVSSAWVGLAIGIALGGLLAWLYK